MSKELEVFNPLKAEITQFVAPALTILVTDFKTSSDALETAKRIKALGNLVEAKRKELVGPLNDEVRRINDYCKQIVQPLDAADSHVKRQLNVFAAEQERHRAEAQRKLDVERRRQEDELRAKQEAERVALAASQAEVSEVAAAFGAEPGEMTPDMELQAKQEVEAVALKTSFDQQKWDADQYRIKNTRKTLRMEVVDIALVPKEFLIVEVNERAAKAAASVGVTIPGLRFIEEFNVAIGAKTRVPRAALE